ncbi:hypothetical protein LOK49_LG13G00030 [Camellia lanceoleosa]|uniref:Uncharacterized protein n=1 Tax=Camellia lanceoleosa TaxID=1840588 RepID=A0ACC0FJ84_9ERIC|nr:hypothetical protein LOK49_LG13G00030 [Camellia lanceoleosa]
MLALEPFSEDQGRSTVQPARGIPSKSASFALYGFTFRLLTRTHVDFGPWFQDGPNGELAGRRRSAADVRHARGRYASHDRAAALAGFSTASALASASTTAVHA